jgi:hypothetical protein
VLAQLGEQCLSAIKTYRAVQTFAPLRGEKPTTSMSPSRPLS